MLVLNRGLFSVAGCALAVAAGGAEPAEQPRADSDAEVLAEVNDAVITVGVLARCLAAMPQGCVLGPDSTQARLPQVAKDALQTLIDDALIVQAFRSRNRTPFTSREVDEEIQRHVPQWYGDDHEANLLRFLAEEDLTEPEFRTLIEESLIVRRLRGEHRLQAKPVTEEQIARHYEENRESFRRNEGVHLRLIRLTADGARDDAALARTTSAVMARLRAGEDFAAIASEVSLDSRRGSGGDWGWVERGDLREELATAAFTCLPGEFTGPVACGGHVFVLKIEAHRIAGIPPLAEVRDQIAALLTGRSAAEAERRWLQELRAGARIWIAPEFAGIR